MVDRIDKLKPSESWKIQESQSSKKDKRNQSEEEKQQNAKSSFEEKPDWDRLIAKDGPGANLLTRNPKNISLKHASLLEDELRSIEQHSQDPAPRAAVLGFSTPRDKMEWALMILAVALLILLAFLILKLFI